MIIRSDIMVELTAVSRGGDENTPPFHVFSLVFNPRQFLCNTISTWQRIACYSLRAIIETRGITLRVDLYTVVELRQVRTP